MIFIKGGYQLGTTKPFFFWESNMGFIIKLLYMALKPFKRPLICRKNKVANINRANVVGARIGAGPSPKISKWFQFNRNGVKLKIFVH